MTDVSTHNDAPSPGDRLVYLPLDALPKDLLSRLGDFKVIVNDEKTGTRRVHPKERLEEVLAGLNRDGDSGRVPPENPDVFADLTARKNGSRTPPSSPDTTIKQSQEQNMFQFSSTSEFLMSPRRRDSSETEKYFTSQKRKAEDGDGLHYSRFQSQSRLDNVDFDENAIPNPGHFVCDSDQPDVYVQPDYGSRMQARVSMVADRELQDFQSMLETTPRKRLYEQIRTPGLPLRKAPRLDDTDSWMYARRSPHRREQPTPTEAPSLQRLPRHDDVIRARKQLFDSPQSSTEMRRHAFADYGCCDRQKENCCRRGYRPLDRSEDFVRSPEYSSRLHHHPPSPRGLKRKQVFVDDAEFTTHYRKAEPSASGHTSTEGIGERLLEMLHPSKRHCTDYTDIGPSRSHDRKVNCACSMMETHFLQMTECAYRNIRRKDSSRESFEQFSHELTQTNSVLKESVSILRAIQQICSHRDQRLR